VFNFEIYQNYIISEYASGKHQEPRGKSDKIGFVLNGPHTLVNDQQLQGILPSYENKPTH